mmetsp:Transcript_102928/g.266092  ORF Transcript_102928/g.266092 Transcript_102928/m.266092 type:complete len:296 (+) Transcript_102928:973-1860(+)
MGRRTRRSFRYCGTGRHRRASASSCFSEGFFVFLAGPPTSMVTRTPVPSCGDVRLSLCAWADASAPIWAAHQKQTRSFSCRTAGALVSTSRTLLNWTATFTACSRLSVNCDSGKRWAKHSPNLREALCQSAWRPPGLKANKLSAHFFRCPEGSPRWPRHRRNQCRQSRFCRPRNRQPPTRRTAGTWIAMQSPTIGCQTSIMPPLPAVCRCSQATSLVHRQPMALWSAAQHRHHGQHLRRGRCLPPRCHSSLVLHCLGVFQWRSPSRKTSRVRAGHLLLFPSCPTECLRREASLSA